jgi:hypothetical protein
MAFSLVLFFYLNPKQPQKISLPTSIFSCGLLLYTHNSKIFVIFYRRCAHHTVLRGRSAQIIDQAQSGRPGGGSRCGGAGLRVRINCSVLRWLCVPMAVYTMACASLAVAKKII